MIRVICAALLASTLAAPATAAVVVSGASPSSFNVLFNGNVEGQNVTGLTAAMTINFIGTANAGKTYQFTYSLTNTSTNPITASRVSGFAFDTTPNIVGAVATSPSAANGGTTFTTVHLPAGLPNGVGAVELCVNGANGQNGSCQGGGNAGVTKGNTGIGGFDLIFNSAIPEVRFDSFYVRYQAIAGTNFGTSGTGTGWVPLPVPEPSTWALMIGGFGMVGGAMRYRRANPATARA